MTKPTYIEAGDYVRDPLEEPDAPLRKVIEVEHHCDGPDTLHLDDGCVMGADEPTDVFLPSEVE